MVKNETKKTFMNETRKINKEPSLVWLCKSVQNCSLSIIYTILSMKEISGKDHDWYIKDFYLHWSRQNRCGFVWIQSSAFAIWRIHCRRIFSANVNKWFHLIYFYHSYGPAYNHLYHCVFLNQNLKFSKPKSEIFNFISSFPKSGLESSKRNCSLLC